MAFTKKKEYYSKKLEEGNGRNMYKVVNKLLDKKQDTVLPEAKSDKELADSLVKFFAESPVTKNTATSPSNVTKLHQFEKTTDEEIQHIIKTYGIKCSPEDPVPNINLDTFVPIWRELVNLLLETGSIDCLKSSAVLPTMKEMDDLMDKDLFKNYRPVSNLLLLEKLTERIVALRLENQMIDNDLHSDEENGYKGDHSAEFLMIKVECLAHKL